MFTSDDAALSLFSIHKANKFHVTCKSLTHVNRAESSSNPAEPG